jgi:hypothetical protein
MCSNPYIDDMLIRQHIAEARAEAVQRHRVQSAKLQSGTLKPMPGIWARVRSLLQTMHWARSGRRYRPCNVGGTPARRPAMRLPTEDNRGGARL